jgi:hypothetical protein
MQVQLRDKLPGLIPILQEETQVAFRLEFPETECSGDCMLTSTAYTFCHLNLEIGWKSISPHMTTQRMVERLNNLVLVGRELSTSCISEISWVG